MSARTQNDFLVAVSKLLDEIVEHELRMRNVIPQSGPVHNKRRQFANVLYDEYMRNIPPRIDPLHLSNDLICSGYFISRCQVDLIHTDTGVKEKALFSLKHLQYKISRITCTSQADMNNCQRMLTLLRMIIDSQNPAGARSSTPNATSGGLSNTQSSQGTQNAASSSALTATSNNNNNNNAQTSSSASANLIDDFQCLNITSGDNANATRENSSRTNTQRPKIYKWNIKFTNESKSLGVFEFIQKVEAKALAYEVSHEQLFQSACELFDGFAAKWFLSQNFRDWNDIKEKLISDFVQVDYLQNLLDTIRQRKQANNEAIVHFFTVFEDDCSRLPVPLSIDEKLNILKKNVLQKYRPYIALNRFNSVDEFKHALKVLEMSMFSNTSNDNNKFVRFSGNSGYSNEYRGRNNSGDHNRSRYDKFHSNSKYERNENRSRSASNTSQHSGDANHSRSNFDRSARPPTPSHRYNSNERHNTSRDRSNSRNSGRAQSSEKKNLN